MRRRRRPLPVLVLGLLIVGLPGCAPRTDLPTANLRVPLHTDGQRILDPSGRHVVLRGLDNVGMQLGEADGTGWRVPPPFEYDDVARWGFNSVRLSWSWGNLEPRPPVGGIHRWNTTYLAALDGIVRQFTERHVGVILSMNQAGWSPAVLLPRGNQPFPPSLARNPVPPAHGFGFPAWLYPGLGWTVCSAKQDFFVNRHGWSGLATAWRFLAKRYASNPYVIGADMLNEPYACEPQVPPEDLHLEQLDTVVGRAIRSVSPHLLLIMEDNAFGRHPSEESLTEPIRLPDVVYSFHLYRHTTDAALESIELQHARAVEWNIPEWVGEFVAPDQLNSLDLTLEEAEGMRAVLRAFAADGISWDYFAYRGFTGVVNERGAPYPVLLATLRAALRRRVP